MEKETKEVKGSKVALIVLITCLLMIIGGTILGFWVVIKNHEESTVTIKECFEENKDKDVTIHFEGLGKALCQVTTED